MMKRYLFLVLLVVNTFAVIAQEVCETPNEDAPDLNSITKCSIKPAKNSKDKKSRQITVKISARKRFLKKREIIKKQTASSVGAINTAGVSALNTDNSIAAIEKTPKIETKKETDYKSGLASIKERLSKEEVRKASRFMEVEKIPAFTSCTSSKAEDRMDCFNMEMIKHIQKYCRYPSEAVRNQIEGEVWVRFIIDKNGYVRNIKTLGPQNGELLKEEARRVVSKLPHFKPARKDGRSVSVKYGFPINFSLEQ